MFFLRHTPVSLAHDAYQVGNVILYLTLLASVISMQAPLPAYLPPAEEARQRLVQKIRTLPVVKRRVVRGGSEGLLYLGYVLMMKVRWPARPSATMEPHELDLLHRMSWRASTS